MFVCFGCFGTVTAPREVRVQGSGLREWRYRCKKLQPRLLQVGRLVNIPAAGADEVHVACLGVSKETPRRLPFDLLWANASTLAGQRYRGKSPRALLS